MGLAIGMTSGGKSVKPKNVGDSVQGVVTGLREVPAKDMEGNPKFFPKSGDPMMQAVIDLNLFEAAGGVPAGGDGVLYCNFGMEKAIGQATMAAGLHELNAGDGLSITLTNIEYKGARQERTYSAQVIPAADLDAQAAA